MPSRVRIISGPRNTSFDHLIRESIDNGEWRVQKEYFGITEEDRANYVRLKIRRAGKHMDPPVSVMAYYKSCTGCANGGPGCRYHVVFSVHTMEEARAYMAAKMNRAQQEAGIV